MLKNGQSLLPETNEAFLTSFFLAFHSAKLLAETLRLGLKDLSSVIKMLMIIIFLFQKALNLKKM